MSTIKKIHYCWFGSKTPDAVLRNVEEWARLNPDFEICEWNEGNTNVSAWEFGRRAQECRKWGFLVDTVRPKALYEEGGFYVDADVEIVRPLSPLLEGGGGDKLIMGYMYNCALGTAILYSPPKHPWIKNILDSYDHIHHDKWPVSNSIFTAYFINHVQGFLLNGKAWENDLCRLYPKEFFEQPAFIRNRGVSIHHCCGSWMPGNTSRAFGVGSTAGLAHLIKWVKRKYRTWRAARNNEFAACHQAALRGVHLPFDDSKFFDGSWR